MATLFGWFDFLFCFSVSMQKLNNCFSTFYYFLICFLGLFCFGQFKIQQSNSKCKITQVFQKPWRIDPSNLILGLITFVKVFKAMSCCHSLEQILRPVSKMHLENKWLQRCPRRSCYIFCCRCRVGPSGPGPYTTKKNEIPCLIHNT